MSSWVSFARRDRQGGGEMDGLYSNMWGQGLPGDPGTPWAGHVHTYVPGAGWGIVSFHSDPELDSMLEELKRTMDIEKREALIKKIARVKHERVAGGLTTYRPVVTFAWRDKVEFRGWPQPGLLAADAGNRPEAVGNGDPDRVRLPDPRGCCRV